MTHLDADQMLDALLRLPRIYGAQISPDARWAAWTWSGLDDTCDVYIAPADASTPPLQLTKSSINTQLAAWSPDSQSVLVIQDNEGDERFRVYRVLIDRPGEMHLLLDPQVQFYVRYPQIHRNGRWLIYGANYDAEADEEIDPFYIYRYDLITKEFFTLVKPKNGGWCKPELNLAGTHVIYNRQERHPSGAQLWMVSINGKEDLEIVNTGDTFKVDGYWLPDSQRVLAIAEVETHCKVGIYDLRNKHLRWLIDDPQRNIEWAYAVPRSEFVVIFETREARTYASLLNSVTSEEIHLEVPFGALAPLAPVNQTQWIGMFSSAQYPTDLIHFSLHESVLPETFKSITRLPQHIQIRPGDLAPAETFHWEAKDKRMLQGWLFHPRTLPRGTIVCIHGGPALHDEDVLDEQVQYFVSQGYTVFQPNYRGSTGFNRAFVEAIKVKGWGHDEQDDIQRGIEALIQSGISEKGRVGITGLCYGGYSAWCQITRNPPEVVAAAIPVCGMTDLVVDFENTRSDFLPYTIEMMGGSPSEVPQKYFDASPINFIHQIKGKLMIVQGMNDSVVSPINMQVVTEALNKAGIPYELVTFSDEGHGIYRPTNLRQLYPAMLEFFRRAFDESPAPSTE
ncbi:MAG: S9 family peptidase [Anaerolineae bacterium]|nr:S9 family peptidase [Anaerolineae bacterium]